MNKYVLSLSLSFFLVSYALARTFVKNLRKLFIKAFDVVVFSVRAFNLHFNKESSN